MQFNPTMLFDAAMKFVETVFESPKSKGCIDGVYYVIDATDPDAPDVCLYVDNRTSPEHPAFTQLFYLENVARYVADLIVSEIRNNDACDIEIRVIAGHFSMNEEMKRRHLNHLDMPAIVVIARVHDSLS